VKLSNLAKNKKNTMAKVEHYFTKFEADKFYHIYNRCIDKKALFKNEDNYYFFLKRYNDYLFPVVQTYAYCLLGNHFHLLIRIRSELELNSFKNEAGIKLSWSAHDMVSHQFRKFFQSYSMAFNKQQGRIGTLFQTPFKRALVTNEKYLKRLVYYIHMNPLQHGLVDDFRLWKWSSYRAIAMHAPNTLESQEILRWFGGAIEFEKFHTDKIYRLKYV